MLISLILGSLVGAVLGMTGAGGGILAVPALVAGMGWSMQQATPVALIAVAGSAAIGTAEAWRRRLVRYRAALVMTAAGMPMTSLGVRLAHRLPQRLLMLMFALVMLSSRSVCFGRPRAARSRRRNRAGVSPASIPIPDASRGTGSPRSRSPRPAH